MRLRHRLRVVQGRATDAAADRDRLLVLAPTVELYRARATARANAGEHGPALEDLTRALALDPTCRDAYRDRASVLYSMDRPQDALADLRRMLALNPDDLEALRTRAAILQNLRRTEEALLDLTRLVELAPSGPALLQRGGCLNNLERHTEALADFERAVELEPEGATNYYFRGLSHAQLGHLDAAIADYDRALALGLRPEDAEVVRGRRAKLAARLGE